MVYAPWTGDLDYSRHALHVMEQRKISRRLVESVLMRPELRNHDPHDPEVERFFARRPERGNRVLRVAVNTRVAPWRLVSVFFDRGGRRKL